MPLTNTQYDEILRGYDARQLKNQRERERRTANAYARIPRLKEIDDAIASCSVAQARKLLEGDQGALASLQEQLAECRSQKEDLLAEHGFPADYFQPVYTCPDCQDTGFIQGRHCHCFKQA